MSAPAAVGALAELPARGAAPTVGRARELLAAIPVRVEDTGAHYDRDEWGDWTSSYGCDTRETVLIRDGHHVRTGSGCRVLSGTWPSPYDGATLTAPRRVDIDHRVPAAEAQRSGARNWTRAQRAAFFNDPTNLAAVSASANRSKGDDDPGRWRPPRRDAWCDYATAYITTKHSYRLHVDPAEHAALTAMLGTCTGGHR
ncbi:HNH endonuclease family protein [Pseudonocardia zijingensis]|uniref:HNH endonuclease family protein n=1 Tax=Pseudonocardia zijingensis TaxID=153376 RepID=UPI0031DC0556